MASLTAAPATRPPLGRLLLVTLLAVACVLATQYGYALRVPFINDDYVFLDKTRAATWGSLWLPRELAFHWYRPWSRELHYWTLQHVFGANELPFHVASMLLILGLGVSYAWLAARLAGPAAAGIATAGLVSMAAWAIPAVWVAGVQDVWMLLLCLLSLIALDAGRRGLATLACALALLSKETAAVLPAIATALLWCRGRRQPLELLRETAGLWGVLAVWAALHPLLGGRLVHPIELSSDPGLHPPLPGLAARTLLALASLDAWPRPAAGWPHALLSGLPAAVALCGLVWFGVHVRRRHARAAATGAALGASATREAPAFPAVAFGLVWAALAWLPLCVPAIGWHAYYTLLGASGAWLALGALLARRPAIAVALIAALAMVRAARATTPSRDWGTEFYQTRAAAFLESMRADLLELHSTVPPHSRLYFVLIPSEVGFLTGDAPVLRVWYHDATLRGGLFKQYALRAPNEPGRDYFFRYDGQQGWIEIAADSSAALPPGDAVAAEDVRALGGAFARAHDWPRAAIQFERLARAAPESPQPAADAGVARAMAGDTAAAVTWLERSLASPAAPESLRAAVRDMLSELEPRPAAGGAAPRR